MKTLYWECAMGAAGDMLMAALYELCDTKEQKQFLTDMNRLIPGLSVTSQPARRQGICGTHMSVIIHGEEEYGEEKHGDEKHAPHGTHTHPHVHRSLQDILTLIDGFSLPDPVLRNAKEVYRRIARAESAVHGTPVGEVHFHEVGALDAVADVVGVCYLLHRIAPDRVAASPIHVGSGTVQTAHGLLPVPAPATAHLLEEWPIYGSDLQGELCTPTGAALVTYFARDPGPLPAGRLLRCGCGCGTKDFPRANCLRAFLLETEDAVSGPNDAVTELKTNLDDMTGEGLGYAMDRLLEAGALDVSFTPLQMKKNRPGVQLTCLCRPSDADRIAQAILQYTSTFGVRRTDCLRYALRTSITSGSVPLKTGEGYGISKSKPEYEPLASAAREKGWALDDLR